MKQVIASGGGGFTMEPNNPLYDYYVLAQSGKKNPSICFLPTASGDNFNYSENFKYCFERLPCKSSVCNILEPSTSDLEDYLLSQDIIYVGGGNSKSLLGIWKEWGVDKTLSKAYDQGILLSGISAGSVCWFEQCISDCYPGQLTVLSCLGLIKGSNVVHYGFDKRAAFQENLLAEKILPGFGVSDGAALHYIDGKLERIVASRPNASAFWTEKNGDEIMETTIAPLLLSEEENFNKLILLTPAFADERE